MYKIIEEDKSYQIIFEENNTSIIIKKDGGEKFRKTDNRMVWWAIYHEYRRQFKDYVSKNEITVDIANMIFRDLMNSLYIKMEWNYPDLKDNIHIYSG